MWKSSVVPQSTQTEAPKERYFKVQMKAWTNFDPMDKTVSEIAQAMEGGNGFLSVVEVLEVVHDLSLISDEDIREGFENVVAAKRLVSALSSLPPKIKDQLRSALDAESNIQAPHLVSNKSSSSSR